MRDDSSELTAHERDLVRKAIRIMTLCEDPRNEELLRTEITGEILLPLERPVIDPDAFHGMLLLCGMLVGLRENETGDPRANTLGHLGMALEILEDQR